MEANKFSLPSLIRSPTTSLKKFPPPSPSWSTMKKVDIFQVTSLGEVSPIPTNSSRFGGSFSILFRWKRSIYKLLWKHMLIYTFTYIMVSLLYQYILNENGKKHFRILAEYCSGYSRSINLMIMLGFFTSTAMQRLFTMQTTVPGTYKSIAVFVLSLKPDLPEGPLIIDLFSRWQLLSWILTFRLVCRPIRKLYPDLISLQREGLLTQEERLAMEQVEVERINTPRPLLVIEWMLLLLKETNSQNRFFTDFNYMKNVDALLAFKKSCGNTIKFATQNIPPAVIQAVILAVYGFGIITLMARTFPNETDPTPEALISYLPIMPGMQFFIYFAWLCFGKAAVDPFGDDEDDIDVKQLVQSHIQDWQRLKDIYARQLGDIFPDLAHRQFNDSVAM